jgi:hypothetical protein
MASGIVCAGGVAVLKEQPFHRDSTAKAVVYQKILATGPYLRLVTFRGNIDVTRSKMVDRIEFPDPPPPMLIDEGDLAPFRNSLTAMTRFASRYPASTPLLKPEMEVVSGYLDHFDAGDVRFEGKWIAKNEIPALLETRRIEAKARKRRDAEKVVENEARKDIGLVRLNGDWVTEKEALERPPAASTQLSSTLWPLVKPDEEGARRALQNLSTLAAGQTGAPKVRTERLHTVIRNLFLAEFRLSQEMIAATAAEAQATTHDRQAAQWLKPNAFGTERDDAARDSLAKARKLRNNAAESLASRRNGLLEQLREADIVTEDFYKLREHRVALTLGETVRAVAARRFTATEFQSTFPDETLAAVRREITSRK